MAHAIIACRSELTATGVLRLIHWIRQAGKRLQAFDLDCSYNAVWFGHHDALRLAQSLLVWESVVCYRLALGHNHLDDGTATGPHHRGACLVWLLVEHPDGVGVAPPVPAPLSGFSCDDVTRKQVDAPNAGLHTGCRMMAPTAVPRLAALLIDAAYSAPPPERDEPAAGTRHFVDGVVRLLPQLEELALPHRTHIVVSAWCGRTCVDGTAGTGARRTTTFWPRPWWTLDRCCAAARWHPQGRHF